MALRAELPTAVRRGLTVWRRSIQVRVVASTVLLSAAVVSIVGWFLLQQTRDGLLQHRVDAVVAEARTETAEARTRLSFATGRDVDVPGQQQELVEPIIDRGATRGFAVILSPPVGSGGTLATGGVKFTQNLDKATVPVALED
ncbi:MAG: two-component sensor histidine kinase, partial [Nocardioides sp.]|nr:two-component sensor histidine kinase [Nocardioides sp.]